MLFMITLILKPVSFINKHFFSQRMHTCTHDMWQKTTTTTMMMMIIIVIIIIIIDYFL